MSESEVMEDNQKLVHYIVHRYFTAYTHNNTCYDYDDIFQIGMEGLLKAHRTYKVNGGHKFSTYAFTVVRNEIRHYLKLAQNSRDPDKSLNFLYTNKSGESYELSEILVDKNYKDSFNYIDMVQTIKPFLNDHYFTLVELQVIKLIVTGNYSNSEISRDLKLNHTTMYKTMLKIRKMLRVILGDKIIKDIAGLRTRRRVDNSANIE